MRLNYAIKFVADMDQAIAFYRDTLGLELKFASPGWSEFTTGETTLALHSASDDNPAGSVQLGLGTDNLTDFYARREELGLSFTQLPTEMHGIHIARIRDSEGARFRSAARPRRLPQRNILAHGAARWTVISTASAGCRPTSSPK